MYFGIRIRIFSNVSMIQSDYSAFCFKAHMISQLRTSVNIELPYKSYLFHVVPRLAAWKSSFGMDGRLEEAMAFADHSGPSSAAFQSLIQLSSSIIPLVVLRLEFWFMLGVHLMTWGAYQSGCFQQTGYVASAVSVDWIDLKILTLLSIFFLAFHVNQCFQRRRWLSSMIWPSSSELSHETAPITAICLSIILILKQQKCISATLLNFVICSIAGTFNFAPPWNGSSRRSTTSRGRPGSSSPPKAAHRTITSPHDGCPAARCWRWMNCNMGNLVI